MWGDEGGHPFIEGEPEGDGEAVGFGEWLGGLEVGAGAIEIEGAAGEAEAVGGEESAIEGGGVVGGGALVPGIARESVVKDEALIERGSGEGCEYSDPQREEGR